MGAISALPYIVRLLETGEPPRKGGPAPIEDREILEGGMPPVVLGQVRRPDLWSVGYEQTYLERDIRELSQLADLVTFRNLARLAALRPGQILNQSDLARDASNPCHSVVLVGLVSSWIPSWP